MLTIYLDGALAWHLAGCSVIPIRADTSKRPAVEWARYQREQATAADVRAWWGGEFSDTLPQRGVAVICGQVSGNLEMTELEGRATDGESMDRIYAAADRLGGRDLVDFMLRDGYSELTPSGGIHMIYRIADHPVPGNTKIANDAANLCLAETRGEGGYVIVAPTGGNCHPSGEDWVALTGMSEQGPVIATITWEQRCLLHQVLAEALDVAKPPPPPQAPRPRPVLASDGLRPGDQYNATMDWADILEPQGWTVETRRGDEIHWTRPGKHRSEGASATTGRNGDSDNLYVFSTSAGLPTETPLSKFFVYAHYHHGGDLPKAASQLRASGYGADSPSPVNIPDTWKPKPPPAQTGPSTVESSTIVAPSGPVKINLGEDSKSIGAIIVAVQQGAIPDLYVQDGRLVNIVKVSGRRPHLGCYDIFPVDADRLRYLLARYAQLVKMKKGKANEDGDPTWEEVPASVTLSTLKSVLSETDWGMLPAMLGIVNTPTMRPNGTLIQQPGYDQATGLFYDPILKLNQIPDRPSKDVVQRARSFLVDEIYGAFPWVDRSDRANFFALLVTQILRPYLGDGQTTPFGVFTATTAASGKSLLTDSIGKLFGHEVRPWVKSETELRKSITALLVGSKGVHTLDNVPEGTVIKEATLAKLITGETWSDRELGTSRNLSLTNDRLWLASGNNLGVGGDMASRTVVVRLDPRMPQPELRTFKLNLVDWINHAQNRASLLEALLILVQDWMVNGAQRGNYVMRGFTQWAQVVGGFCDFHDITGFLDNTDAVGEMDQEDGEWAAFLASWQAAFGEKKKSASQIRASADQEWTDRGPGPDRWGGTFITTDEGEKPNVKQLGRKLSGQKGRYHGGLCLRVEKDLSSNVNFYWVEVYKPDQ